MSDYPETILVEPDEADERVVICTFNRPEALNAMNSSMLEGFRLFVERLRDGRQARVAVLTGAGRAFSAPVGT